MNLYLKKKRKKILEKMTPILELMKTLELILMPPLRVEMVFYLFIGVDFLEITVDNLQMMMFTLKLLMYLWLSLMLIMMDLLKPILCPLL